MAKLIKPYLHFLDIHEPIDGFLFIFYTNDFSNLS